MARFFILLLLLLIGVIDNTAQDFDNYQLLKSEGTIPKDFLLLSSEKFQADREQISEDEKRSTRKSKEEFLLGSNYMVDRLLTSGRVLFNDPVSDYLNKIVDKILEHDPEHDGQVRAYAVKSSSVNAFATNNGIILVNLGLIAQLETEAQLAYILSHELIHYFNDHVMNVYLENEQIEKGRGAYRGTSLSERLISSSNYSKEIETEADVEGLKLFQGTEYGTESLGGVFDVLHYAYLPFNDIEFDKSFFETEHLVFPQEYFLEEVSQFSPFEEEDDSRSSHPSTYKRKLLIEKKINALEERQNNDYLVSKEEFERIRKISRYELSSLYFNNEEYELAIYNSYMLLKDNPDSKYLKKNICKSLYSLVKYSNNDDFYQVHTRYKKTEGSSQQLFHLMEKMSRQDRNATALRYVWEIHNQYPDDEDLKKIANDLIKELAEHHYEEGFFLEHPIKEEATDSTTSEVDTLSEDNNDTKRMSKYDKIRAQRKEEVTEIKNTEFIRLAFVDLYNDDDFRTNIEKAFAEAETEKKLDSETRYKNKERKARAKAKEDKRKFKHGHLLGIDKAVVINPFFMKLDLRKGEKVKYEQSESALLRYYDKIKWTANSLDLDIDILTMSSMDSMDTERFNDVAFLSNWIDSRFSQLDQDMVEMEAEKLNVLKEKYGTKYFCWTGVMNFRKKQSTNVLNLCVGIVVPPFLPFAIYSMIKPRYETYYYYIAFDLDTGEPAMAIFNQFPQGDSQDYINVNIYDSLYQLKTKRRKED